MKSVIKLAGLGALGGIAIETLIWIVSCGEMSASAKLIDITGSLQAAMFVQLLFSALYGAVCFGMTIIYNIERLPLALASFIHCSICILPFIPMAMFLGWVNRPEEALFMSGGQLIAYFFVWLFMYLGYRKEIRELNKMQHKMAEKTEELKRMDEVKKLE